jgi:hypothetical protein
VTDQNRPTTSTKKGKSYAARCDSQFSDVCVLTLSRLRREDGPHKNASLHRPIGVRKGHLVVWIADGEENFQFSKFDRVDCKDERKRIDDSNDPGPFDNHYERDSYGKVKYSIVTGPVGNCYKHSIDVDNGKDKKEHIDPHIMIECDTGPC